MTTGAPASPPPTNPSTTAAPVQEWELVAQEVAYQGFLRMDSRDYRLPDGRRARWDLLVSGPCVAVVAVTESGNVVLAAQYRPGPGRVLDELPGGMVDPGEDVAEAAARELLEETGYRAASVEVLGGTWLAGFSTIYKHIALARGCRLVTSPEPGSDEFAAPHEVTRGQFIALLRSGELTDSEAGYRCADHLGWLAPPTG